VVRSQQWDQDIAGSRQYHAPASGGGLTERIEIADVQTTPIQPAPVAAGAIMDRYVGVVNMGTSWREQPKVTPDDGFHKGKIE